MNNTQKKMLSIGVVLLLLSGSMPSIAASHPACRSSVLGEPPKLKYYVLDIRNCKSIPGWLKENRASSATLTNDEFEQLKTVLQNSLARYNLKNQGNSDFRIIGLYGVQCLPYIDKNGHKKIWINGFCEDGAMYQKPDDEIITAFDGGPCFFNTTMRAGSKKAVPISIHGFA